jgi:hypothetical protein
MLKEGNISASMRYFFMFISFVLQPANHRISLKKNATILAGCQEKPE